MKQQHTSLVGLYRNRYAWGGDMGGGNPSYMNDPLYKSMVRMTTPSSFGTSPSAGSPTLMSNPGSYSGATSTGGTGSLGSSIAGAAPAALNLASEIIPVTSTGRKSVGSYVLKGAGSGAALGASVAGPWGAVIGGAVGAIGGWIGGGAAKRKEGRVLANADREWANAVRQNSANRIYNDPSLTAGYQGGSYFANGGQMGAGADGVLAQYILDTNPSYMEGPLQSDALDGRLRLANGGSLYQNYLNQQANGGHLSRLSDSGVEASGNTHAEGGISLPGYGAEIEDGETIYKDYVFSKRLGFADRHKPIARAIGKIEGKPLSIERINSLRRLEDRTARLAQEQEIVKAYA